MSLKDEIKRRGEKETDFLGIQSEKFNEVSRCHEVNNKSQKTNR